MCGIAGLFGNEIPEGSLRARLEGMADALRHRGPDAAGIWTDASAGIGLAHRRLAIIDLSPRGAQPMMSASGRYALVFNGEIYNHRELRLELRGRGYPFSGDSDTEVLLAGFEHWGVARTLPRLVGMFALASWDKTQGTLSLAVDRLGEKPLHYARMGRNLAFASELKALKTLPEWQPEIEPDSVAEFFSRGYIAPPHSIYRGVKKVRPGTICQFHLGRIMTGPKMETYWSLHEAAQAGRDKVFTGTAEDAVFELDRLLREAVELQMVADVPVGAFLSGGVDSSTIVAMMQRVSNRPVKTFAVGFSEQKFNEAHYARRVAAHLHTDHTEILVTSQDALKLVERIGAIYDEPFADASQIPTLRVAELARRHVTVSLSGDAGDELFLGYKNYAHAWRMWRALRWAPSVMRIPAAGLAGRALTFSLGSAEWRRWFERGARALPARSLLDVHRLLTTSGTRPAATAREPIHNQLGSNVGLESMTALGVADLQSYLPGDILVKVDRATMATSLESRIPMLDHRVVNFALSLPDDFKYRNGYGKWVLRSVLDRYLPRELVDRPKQGFGVPVAEWLRGPLRPWASDLLGYKNLRHQNWIDAREVECMWHEHLSGLNDMSGPLWSRLIFLQWLRTESRQVAKHAKHD